MIISVLSSRERRPHLTGMSAYGNSSESVSFDSSMIQIPDQGEVLAGRGGECGRRRDRGETQTVPDQNNDGILEVEG